MARLVGIEQEVGVVVPDPDHPSRLISAESDLIARVVKAASQSRGARAVEKAYSDALGWDPLVSPPRPAAIGAEGHAMVELRTTPTAAVGTELLNQVGVLRKSIDEACLAEGAQQLAISMLPARELSSQVDAGEWRAGLHVNVDITDVATEHRTNVRRSVDARVGILLAIAQSYPVFGRDPSETGGSQRVIHDLSKREQKLRTAAQVGYILPKPGSMGQRSYRLEIRIADSIASIQDIAVVAAMARVMVDDAASSLIADATPIAPLVDVEEVAAGKLSKEGRADALRRFVDDYKPYLDANGDYSMVSSRLSWLARNGSEADVLRDASWRGADYDTLLNHVAHTSFLGRRADLSLNKPSVSVAP